MAERRSGWPRSIGLRICVLIVAFVTCAGLFSQIGRLPWVDVEGSDWVQWFRPCALSLRDPFAPRPIAYPPWLFLVLWPLAILPAPIGFGLIVALDVLILAIYVRSIWRVLLLCLSWPVMLALVYGQIDPLLVLVFMLPARWALVAASMKPQIVCWFALRRGRLAAFLPLGLVVLGSLILWGWWPGRLSMERLAWEVAVDLDWPKLVPVGLALLASSDGLAWLGAGILLSPYVLPYHLTPVLAYAYRRGHPLLLLAITVVSWLVVL